MIYIITKENGYGNDRICAATTDRSKADIIRKLCSDAQGDAEIKRFEDGEIGFDLTKAKNAWHITICHHVGDTEPMVNVREFVTFQEFEPHEHFNSGLNRCELHVYTAAETEEEALTIARRSWNAHKGSSFGIA